MLPFFESCTCKLRFSSLTNGKQNFHVCQLRLKLFLYGIKRANTAVTTMLLFPLWFQLTFNIEAHHHHHHHHVHEGLGVFPVPWSSKWSLSLHLFFGRPMFLRPFGLSVVLVLAFYLFPSSVRVVATSSGTVLFPLLCCVLPFFS